MIFHLSEQDIISGLFPRVKSEDLRRAMELGIILPSKQVPENYNQKDGQLYDFNINTLQRIMERMTHKMADKEHGYMATQHLAGLADKAIDAASSGGMVQLSKSANPFNS